MNNFTEREIISTFLRHSTANHSSLIKGIGDDCAILKSGERGCQVITSDTLTQDSHFILELSSPSDLAYKSLASNISDVLAMGATPQFAIMAFTFNDQITKEWVEEFSLEFNSLASQYNIELIGGDTTYSSKAVTITITLIGWAEEENIKTRSGAKKGDSVFCINPLGGSALGLKHLLAGNRFHPSVKVHFRPTLFMKQALWLAEQHSVGAMMDISDGIAKDILHIIEQSDVGCTINLDKLPIYDGATLSMAVEGGEEYSLLFTVRGDHSERLKREYYKTFGSNIYEIGLITSNKGELKWLLNGEDKGYNFKGYEHGR
ncbi:MAG: thiamine-phosphate kinase [Rikenellaceae bacterium]